MLVFGTLKMLTVYHVLLVFYGHAVTLAVQSLATVGTLEMVSSDA